MNTDITALHTKLASPEGQALLKNIATQHEGVLRVPWRSIVAADPNLQAALGLPAEINLHTIKVLSYHFNRLDTPRKLAYNPKTSVTRRHRYSAKEREVIEAGALEGLTKQQVKDDPRFAGILKHHNLNGLYQQLTNYRGSRSYKLMLSRSKKVKPCVSARPASASAGKAEFQPMSDRVEPKSGTTYFCHDCETLYKVQLAGFKSNGAHPHFCPSCGKPTNLPA